MTDKNFDDSTRQTRLDQNELVALWVKGRLISVEGPLHRFVPKEPAWCQVLGNEIERILRKQMSIRP
jgi:hypothetical protein